ncbi:hypothetical protein A2853_01785 [Candidatus Kaiserbacteria bacterium RIFCSPHIGHO2_01_FULL_55_17]|uniref:Uncharacterized protein n=1 Tax=Candidatus Kaiserbacteria bacterium RIFCSPHIGHO2_01_FULL_55_17 TaxID=1798484 RepID=A0A1F6D820_9BACT|nr:MAG: hypothetical protein A2853_01785 [Candidatus Kaiserbacteria bacterium RIFCSPHIGHO2_01_FULL_55_17]
MAKKRSSGRQLASTRLEKQIAGLPAKIDKLTTLVQEEFHSMYERQTSLERRIGMADERISDLADRTNIIRKEINEGFARVERRMDTVIQPQLDTHATRIKKLEGAVFSK